jgi:hypothetical protein
MNVDMLSSKINSTPSGLNILFFMGPRVDTRGYSHCSPSGCRVGRDGTPDDRILVGAEL